MVNRIPSSSAATSTTNTIDSISSIPMNSASQGNSDVQQGLSNVENSPTLLTRCLKWFPCIPNAPAQTDDSSSHQTDYYSVSTNTEACSISPMADLPSRGDPITRSFIIGGQEKEWRKGTFYFAKEIAIEEATLTTNFFHRAYHHLVTKLANAEAKKPLSDAVSVTLAPNGSGNNLSSELSHYPMIQFSGLNSEEKLTNWFIAAEKYMAEINSDTASKQKQVFATMLRKVNQHLCLHTPEGMTRQQIEAISARYSPQSNLWEPVHEQ